MIAYNPTWLHNLHIVKEAKRWSKQGFISRDQFSVINGAFPSNFYHPNFMIRILLFIASIIALGGVTGILGLIFLDAFEDSIAGLSFVYGIASWIILELVFVKKNNHYKSGVNEALLYHSLGWTIGGLVGLVNENLHIILVLSFFILAFSALRYIDFVSTLCALGVFGYLVFMELYELDGIARQIIPFVFILLFTPIYFAAAFIRKKAEFDAWNDLLMIVEAVSLLLVYCAGNYLVVRELSIELMNLDLREGEDIPFAWIFYTLTVVIPVLYLYAGIKNKNVVLLRVSLIALAFSTFTFKYYFSLGHPEITLTLAGAVMLTISLALFRFLRQPRNGFTRENLLKEKWASANPEAFIISQTMGGNKMQSGESIDAGGGGVSSGGGSSERW